jgi:fumarylacetoacetase
MALDETHNPEKKSFIDVDPDGHFPIQNLPFGVFNHPKNNDPHICTAIGDFVVDLHILDKNKLFSETEDFEGYEWAGQKLFNDSSLNKLMGMGRKTAKEIRQALSYYLDAETETIRDDEILSNQALFHQDTVEMLLPVQIGDYTDFYSSKEHATNVGTMFRGKENALKPNWTHLPVGYHGRASSIVVSGTDIHRPVGQTMKDEDDTPSFGPCKLMDFELEMGFFTCGGNLLGDRISVNKAEDHIWGMVLVNDWSARDIQKWEYVPLGPFLAKNFATSISPWVVTLDALEPFRTKGPEQDPEPLPYLKTKGKRAVDIDLEVFLNNETLEKPHKITHSNFRYLYWNMAQQLAHHSVTGCNMRTGDLLASGTISGEKKTQYGSMLELSWKGTEPIELPNGEKRTFLEDGDTVTMKGWCQHEEFRVGFGEVNGKVLPAKDI